MTLIQDLRSAKAAVETPAAWEASGRHIHCTDAAFLALSGAYLKSGFAQRFAVPTNFAVFRCIGSTTHDDIMSLFGIAERDATAEEAA